MYLFRYNSKTDYNIMASTMKNMTKIRILLLSCTAALIPLFATGGYLKDKALPKKVPRRALESVDQRDSDIYWLT